MKYFFTVFFVLVAACLYSQDFQWMKGGGSLFTNQANYISTTSEGDIITIGHFTVSVDFDFDPNSSYDLTFPIQNQQVHSNLFIHKMNADGDFIWAKGIDGTTLATNGDTWVADKNGSTYIAGQFTEQLDVDPSLNSHILSSNGIMDFYVMRLDQNGEFMWGNSFGGIAHDNVHGIDIDSMGNCYLNGSFNSTIDFDPGPDSVIVNPVGTYDSFILKLDKNGNFLWVKTIESSAISGSYFSTLKVTDAGHIYFLDWYSESTDLDPGPGIHQISPSAPNSCFFIRFDTNGDFITANELSFLGVSGGLGGAVLGDFEIDDSGSTYLGGRMWGTIPLEIDQVAVLMESDGLSNDAFIVKLDSGGEIIWAKRDGGPNPEQINDLFYSTNGEIYCAGHIAWGGGLFNPGPTVVAEMGGAGFFVQKISSDGDYLSVRGADNGAGSIWANGITLSSDGSIYTCGGMMGVVQIDSNNVSSEYSSNINLGSDLWIMKLTETQDEPIELDYAVFPNPFSNELTIQLDKLHDLVTIQMIDLSGQLLMEKSYDHQTNILINCKQLSSGVYFIKIVLSDGVTKIHKLTKS